MSKKNAHLRLSLFAVVLAILVIAAFWVGCQKEADTVFAPEGTNAQSAGHRGRIAQDISQVMAVQASHTKALLAKAGVVGTSTTTNPAGGYAIKIMTKQAGMARQLPNMLEGIPVIVVDVGEIRAHAAPTDRIRPVPGGVSGMNIANRPPGPNPVVCFAGTIGAIVEKNGKKYLLSNNHVFARSNRGQPGESIVQPSPADHDPVCEQDENDIVAKLSEFKKINWLHTGLTNDIDAAIAEVMPGIGVDCTIFCGYSLSGSIATAELGMEVKKCGRTTGLTFGQVTDVNATIVVNYEPDGYAVYEHQIGFTDIASGGDSGSLIVTKNGNDPLALEFAGSDVASFGNPIQAVVDYFGVNFCNN